MLTAPDRFVVVAIQDAREQWVAKDRLLRTVLASGGVALRAQDLNTGAAVGWRDGEDPDVVARRIRDQVAGVNVQIPSELSSLLRQSAAFFSALLVGIGLLAFVIGGLSLANTVAAAVFERIRDFGVKRALGATDWQLGREILAEALAVTLSGGALGVLLAMVLGLGIDGWARRSGQQLFLFSPRLLGGALVFSLLLGAAHDQGLGAARSGGGVAAGRRRRAMALLERLGVAGRRAPHPARLPGGEQQRVAFCRAVLNDPPLLLADEPTGNLDDANGAVIFDALRSRARAGAAVVVVSHRPEAATGATAVYRLRGGVLEA